jgi:CspA family cold shock protein
VVGPPGGPAQPAYILSPQFYLCPALCSCTSTHPKEVALVQGTIHFYYPPHMLTGTVKFFNDSKGFGFIIADDSQEEIFVHQTGLIHEIQEGDKVQFNIKAGKKGPNAVDVTRLQ